MLFTGYSNLITQVFIKLKDKDAGLSAEVKVAKMSMIDLAGSEKVNFTVRCKFNSNNPFP